jgi:hypothetical protein
MEVVLYGEQVSRFPHTDGVGRSTDIRYTSFVTCCNIIFDRPVQERQCMYNTTFRSFPVIIVSVEKQ